MKNIISYYYNIYPLDITEVDDTYFFKCNDSNYVFLILKRPTSDIDALYELNKKMIDNNILVHEIINNNDKKAITYVNKKPYVLLKLQLNGYGLMNSCDIYYINNHTIGIETNEILSRTSWVELWESKNDYFEAQLTEFGNKYKIIHEYLNYYIGLSENAILYVKEALKIDGVARTCICHKRIGYNETLYRLYNPLGLINDYYIRDTCEYVKSTFFNDRKKAFDVVIEFLCSANLNYKELLLFYGRLLYPSYFFDLYDDIVNGIKKEDEIECFIKDSSSYEQFLKEVYFYISKYVNIPQVDWLIK